MNTYAKICTHQQRIDTRRNAAAILSSFPAKESIFKMAHEPAKKTHLTMMIKQGYLDGWYFRINVGDRRFEVIPARDLPTMVDRFNWSKI